MKDWELSTQNSIGIVDISFLLFLPIVFFFFSFFVSFLYIPFNINGTLRTLQKKKTTLHII